MSKWNNYRGFDIGNQGGGGKWLYTTGFIADNHNGSENCGPGLWFDTDDAEYAVQGGLYWQNRGMGSPSINFGQGIRLEANPVEGRVSDVQIIGTGGFALDIVSSDFISLERNVVVGSSVGVSVTIDHRATKMNSLAFSANSFGDWTLPYKAGSSNGINTAVDIGLSLGASGTLGSLAMESDVYDTAAVTSTGHAVVIDGTSYASPSALAALHLEPHGSVATVMSPVAYKTPSSSDGMEDLMTIAGALAGHVAGDVVTIPIAGISSVQSDGTVVANDMDTEYFAGDQSPGTYLVLTVPASKTDWIAQQRTFPWPPHAPTSVKIDSISADGLTIHVTLQ